MAACCSGASTGREHPRRSRCPAAAGRRHLVGRARARAAHVAGRGAPCPCASIRSPPPRARGCRSDEHRRCSNCAAARAGSSWPPSCCRSWPAAAASSAACSTGCTSAPPAPSGPSDADVDRVLATPRATRSCAAASRPTCGPRSSPSTASTTVGGIWGSPCSAPRCRARRSGRRRGRRATSSRRRACPHPPPPGQAWADDSLKDAGVEVGDTLLVGPAATPIIVDRLRRRHQLPAAGRLWVNLATWRATQNANRPDAFVADDVVQALVVQGGGDLDQRPSTRRRTVPPARSPATRRCWPCQGFVNSRPRSTRSSTRRSSSCWPSSDCSSACSPSSGPRCTAC